jgi:hypothetical protein
MYPGLSEASSVPFLLGPWLSKTHLTKNLPRSSQKECLGLRSPPGLQHPMLWPKTAGKTDTTRFPRKAKTPGNNYGAALHVA